MEVVPLREMKTQHDLTVKGRMLRLRIDTCGHDGFVVQYVAEEKLPEHLPPFVLSMMGFSQGKEGVMEKVIVQQHVHPRWFDKLLNIKMEDRLKKKIEEIKSDFKEIQERQTLAERLAQDL